jgi:hypothetical protein
MTSETPASGKSADALPPAPLEDDKPFSVADYLVVNALFIGFVLVLYVAMRAIFPDTSGLTFFFGVIIAGFIGVSAYDFLFDRLCAPSAEEPPKSE